MQPHDIFVMTQDTELFQDANQDDLTGPKQDLSSIVDDASLPILIGTTVPCGMTHPVLIPIIMAP